jgi:enhancing lycopene biosynthesis protein 2
MKKVAGILAGCGFLDGAEIQEVVLCQLALERRGVALQWFAPDMDQHHVVDHLRGRDVPGTTRNVLEESARMVRGAVKPLAELDPAQVDGLLMPGGFGVAKHLCTWAFKGGDMDVLPVLEEILLQGQALRRPMAFVCIAPVIAAKVLGRAGTRPQLSTGESREVAEAFFHWGAVHVDCAADEICVDGANLLVSTPAWNAAKGIAQVAVGIDKLGERLSRMI